MLLTLLALFLVPFAFSVIATGVMKRIAPRIGLLDHPADRKLHTRSTPLGGGIAIFVSATLTLGLGLAAAFILDRYRQAFGWVPPFIFEHLDGILSKAGEMALVLGGGAALAAMGLVDDRRGLSALLKLAVEFVVAAVIVTAGARSTMLIGSNAITWTLSVLWIVGITNSFNLLDNMDGLSAGIAAIVGAILIAVALQSSPPQIFIAALLIVLVGAVVGFLLFNFPPASIFMGDCGSLFIGFLLAVAAIRFTYIWPGLPEAKRLIPIAVPLLVFSVPIYDTASVVLIRLREGRHPFDPDKKHFSHRLLDIGMTRREALFTIYMVTFAIGISATLLYSLKTAGALVVLAQAVGILCIIILLEHTGLRRNTK